MEAIANTRQGKILGTIKKSYKDDTFYSFQGIPYGKPPIGNLRFKAPVPADPWDGVLNATKERDSCYQFEFFFRKETFGSEDCLYLNIYTRNISNQVQKKLKPVMVFIHGGGFACGSGNSDIFGPDYLMTEDIVLVTLNYRLGIFGFLNFEDPSLGVPGNAGMKDMVLALKWVQDNIKNFCGDPNNVTIFGESAGGAAVHYLILSPMTKGLFHKAIIQSACALNSWATGKRFTEEAWKKAGIDETDGRKVLALLQTFSKEKLNEIYELLNTIVPSAPRYFAPIVENTNLEAAFISESPIEIIRSGKYNQVPLIIGYNSNEGTLSEIFKATPSMLKAFQEIELCIPYYLNYKNGSQKTASLVKKVRQFYFKNSDISEANLTDIYDLMSDTTFLIEITAAIKNQLITSKYPIYLYIMTIETSLNIGKKLLNSKGPGVSHVDDLGYLFKSVLSPAKIEAGSVEDNGITKFVKLWTNFAHTGNPTPHPNDEILNIKWDPSRKDFMIFLEIGEKLKMIRQREEKRMLFWREIFDNYPELSGFL